MADFISGMHVADQRSVQTQAHMPAESWIIYRRVGARLHSQRDERGVAHGAAREQREARAPKTDLRQARGARAFSTAARAQYAGQHSSFKPQARALSASACLRLSVSRKPSLLRSTQATQRRHGQRGELFKTTARCALLCCAHVRIKQVSAHA